MKQSNVRIFYKSTLIEISQKESKVTESVKSVTPITRNSKAQVFDQFDTKEIEVVQEEIQNIEQVNKKWCKIL